MRYRLCHSPSLDVNVVLLVVTISPSVKRARSALRLSVVLFENVSVQPPVMRRTCLSGWAAMSCIALVLKVESQPVTEPTVQPSPVHAALSNVIVGNVSDGGGDCA